VSLAVVETIVEEHGVEPLLLRVRDVDHKGRLRTGQALNHRVHIGVEEKKGECICLFRWSVHHNFARDGTGRYSESGGGGVHLPPSPGWADFTIMMGCIVRQKVALATLCLLFALNYHRKRGHNVSNVAFKHYTGTS
jgi:hypothetical protein